MQTDMEAALAVAENALREDVVIEDAVAAFGDGRVVLPVGLETPTGLVSDALVRELNGYDEEVVGRLKSPGARLAAILNRGVVQVGESQASTKTLDSLTIPDRIELFLAIRTVTWGDQVQWNIQCSDCGAESEVGLSLSRDVPRKPASASGLFAVSLPFGRAEVRWPNGKVHERLMSGSFKSTGELVTYLIAQCVESIDDMPLLDGEESARALPSRVRKELFTILMDDLPGPQLDEVPLTCPACGSDVPVQLWLGAIFPL